MLLAGALWKGIFDGDVTHVGEALAAVETHSLEATVAEHLYDLGVLLAILLEGEFTTLVVVLLGTPSAVLAALFVTTWLAMGILLAVLCVGAAGCPIFSGGGGGVARGLRAQLGGCRHCTFPLFLGIAVGGVDWIKIEQYGGEQKLKW
jgi:hypothetical protein